ncbi:hypothetical protein ACLBW0_09215 [Enterobacteriaceae bacterium C34A]
MDSKLLNRIAIVCWCVIATLFLSTTSYALDPVKEQLEQKTRSFTEMLVDKVWELDGLSTDDVKKPTLEVHDTDLPAYIKDGTLSVPLSFAAQMTLSGMMLQHDIAVDNDEQMTVQSPLVNRPVTVKKFISLLPDYTALVGDNNLLNTAGFLGIVQCSENTIECRGLTNKAMVCLSLFIIGHEITHHVKRHHVNAVADYPLELELEADQGGLAVLNHLVQQDGNQWPTIAKEACLISPVFYFQLIMSQQMTQQARDVLDTRKERLLDSMPENSLSSLTYPDSFRGGLGYVAITWQEEPKLILLDGMKMQKSDFDKLLLPVGLHHLLYSNSDGVGLNTFRVRNGSTVTLDAVFSPYTALSGDQLLQKVAAKDWLSVLQATSNTELRPNSTDVREAHWKVLRNLSAAAWINPGDLSLMDDNIASRAMRWYQAAQSLYFWDESLVTGDRIVSSP